MSRSICLMFAAGTFTCVFALASSAIARESQCGDLSTFKAEVATAEGALAHKDYRRANELANSAIKKIGDRYWAPKMIDDTGQKLSLADWRQSQGDLKAAAGIRVRMARDRLEALLRKSSC